MRVRKKIIYPSGYCNAFLRTQSSMHQQKRKLFCDTNNDFDPYLKFQSFQIQIWMAYGK